MHIFLAEFQKAGVEIRGCEKTRRIIKGIKKASEKDWYTEYLDLILSVKVVKDVDEAIKHIMKYGSYHSDAIVTKNKKNAEKFLGGVDSAAVYVNASTRFTDGGEFGKGAEMGISTDKIHARGPMGLEELTSYKYMVYGIGYIAYTRILTSILINIAGCLPNRYSPRHLKPIIAENVCSPGD